MVMGRGITNVGAAPCILPIANADIIASRWPIRRLITGRLITGRLVMSRLMTGNVIPGTTQGSAPQCTNGAADGSSLKGPARLAADHRAEAGTNQSTGNCPPLGGRGIAV